MGRRKLFYSQRIPEPRLKETGRRKLLTTFLSVVNALPCLHSFGRKTNSRYMCDCDLLQKCNEITLLCRCWCILFIFLPEKWKQGKGSITSRSRISGRKIMQPIRLVSESAMRMRKRNQFNHFTWKIKNN